MNKLNNIKANDDLEGIEYQSNSLDYNIQQQVQTKNILSVVLDEPIKEPSYYRHVSQAICNLSEEDEVHFYINSPGGTYAGLQTLLSSMQYSGAWTVGIIQGGCSSAASMLTLSCQEVRVSPLASMLVHFVSYGSAGSASHIKAHVEHTQRTTENIFREIYSGFLSEEEINSCIEDDKQIYLDADDIITRLEKRSEYLKALQDDEDEEAIEYTETLQEPLKYPGNGVVPEDSNKCNLGPSTCVLEGIVSGTEEASGIPKKKQTKKSSS